MLLVGFRNAAFRKMAYCFTGFSGAATAGQQRALLLPVPISTPMQTATSILETLGPYTLIREIGRGGMSVVYQAVDRRTGKTVALKTHSVPPSLTRAGQHEALVRFGREARAIGRLSHPNIISIYEVGEHEGLPFLAMEYLDGQTLHQHLAGGSLTPALAAPILGQVAEAMDSVHAAGIIHRDIKSSNIMLLPDGQAKLLDFGIARQSQDTTITAAHSIVGSPTYMAPEQIAGDLGESASDIWALGVLLYEMLAGHPPFEGASIPSVLYKVTHDVPAPVPDVSPPVQQIVLRALEKNPAARYPSGHALADAFQAAVTASPRLLWKPRLQRGSLWAALLIVGIALGDGLAAHRWHDTSDQNVVLQPPLRPASAITAPPALISRDRRRSPRQARPFRRHHRRRTAALAQARRPAGAPTMPPRRLAARPQNSRHFMTRHRAFRPISISIHGPTGRSFWKAFPRPLTRTVSQSHVQTTGPTRRPAVLRLESSPPEALVTPAPPSSPPPHPQASRDPKKADSKNLQDLERFIWSQGR